MSSSCRRIASLALPACAAFGLTATVTANAAQTFVQPQMDVRAETNSNVDLDPDGSPDGNVDGYMADLQVLLGYATERGETTFRPRVRLQHYPKRDEREKFEGFADLVSRYKWERSGLDVIANYSQQDSYNYDTRSGEFDPLDPNDPTAPGAGRFLTGETQTEFDLRPNYSYKLTERWTVAAGAEYQTTDYDADQGQPDQVDYDYWRANTEVRWALDPRSHVGAGVYFSQYDTKGGTGDSDVYGIGASYGHLWSEVTGIEVVLGYEIDDPKYPEPGEDDQSNSNIGGSITAFGEGEVSKWRVVASQRYAPSGDGRVREIGQIRFQYDRDFTERLGFRGAARYESENNPSGGTNEDDEQTARMDLSLRWLLSRTWYVQGGYAYIWQDDEAVEGDAYNNRFFLSAGYKGLGRQRR